MGAEVLHILGASGAGTSSLARAISQLYGHVHLDTDDFFWLPTDPPFTAKREIAARQALLGEAIRQNPQCVISGALDGWGDIFIPMFDLVVFLSAPTEVRLSRLHCREQAAFGGRILPGGDMYESHTAFLDWAAGYDTGGLDMRSAALHEKWLARLPCPVVRLDGTRPCPENAALLAPWLNDFLSEGKRHGHG